MDLRHNLCLAILFAASLVAGAGCQQMTTVRGQQPEPLAAHGLPADGDLPIPGGAPSEMDKVSLPAYVLEPPDILLIDSVTLIPKPPYKIETLDILQILVIGTLLDQPIAGAFAVDPGGMVDLGPAYGKVLLEGLTVEEATVAVDRQLRRELRNPQVSVTLAQSAGQQPIAGEHLIGPDGMVNLGTYGRVYVSGMTLDEAKVAVERKLSEKLDKPQVSIDVFAYNSKAYYVVQEGAGLGDNIVRIPITGNETVLDALAFVQGRTRLNSKKIWIARPAPSGVGCDQILPVNWDEITKGAATATNYQILPGDRLFVSEDKLVALDSFIARLTAPFERIFGFSLLASQTIQNANQFPKGSNSF